MSNNIPKNSFKKLMCKKCGSEKLNKRGKGKISCAECEKEYRVVDGIPSMMDEDKVDSQEWNSHDEDWFDKGANSYYKRAVGELPEKESSKSLARLLNRRNIFSSGDRILDLGCAAGHFLKSLRRILDHNTNYTGIDVSMKCLQWAREIYGIDDSTSFVQCDALNMPFEDNSFETVYANLFHFFPDISKALRESIRVSKDRVLWRTPLGETTYIVKEVLEDDYGSIGSFDARDEDINYTLYMIYSEEYLKGLIDSMGWNIEFIKRDNEFDDFDNRGNFEGVPATRVVDGKQINGNLVLDWHYISITSS